MEALEVNMGFKGASKQAYRDVLRGERVHGLDKVTRRKILRKVGKMPRRVR